MLVTAHTVRVTGLPGELEETVTELALQSIARRMEAMRERVPADRYPVRPARGDAAR